MTPFSVALIGSAGIVLVEGILWLFFRRKVEGIHFPHMTDASQWKFFSLKRIGICAIAHTVFLILSILWFSVLAT